MSRQKPFVVLPPEVTGQATVTIQGYQDAAHRTDRMGRDDLGTPILGLFGEIGSLLAALKKKRREGEAYATYDATILEELGDALWYLSTVASHSHIRLALVAQRVPHSALHTWDEETNIAGITFGNVQKHATKDPEKDVTMAAEELAACAGDFVEAHRTGKLSGNRDAISGRILGILRALVSTADAAGVDLDLAAHGNLEKTFSRWPLADTPYPEPVPSDRELPLNERLPRQFRMFIKEYPVGGKTYVLQKRNGVIIGDRLTDNKSEKDDYRFHDVFHIANAVHLEWSPVLRSLFRVKRKSCPELDESEDGARAILIEEGIATFVFGRALERKLFEGLRSLDYDLLKLVQDLVRGFEAERCAAWQWERAFLDGFKVFREIIRPENRGGWVIADLDKHTLDFTPGQDDGLS
ncbi:nucleoside triphosphate pyrophosphohydrolase family protein [Sorangium sp. So ce1014]|uniref:nucleoside triphosphate pyrophosphohydrolase family protein n=1 Tax=Sorangium sp. So ce1014 TaxID=3133326 RepID=UPI003F5F3778